MRHEYSPLTTCDSLPCRDLLFNRCACAATPALHGHGSLERSFRLLGAHTSVCHFHDGGKGVGEAEKAANLIVVVREAGTLRRARRNRNSPSEKLKSKCPNPIE
jgi:hypothetical protein